MKKKKRKEKKKKERKKERKTSQGNVVRQSKTELQAVLKLDNNVRQCAVKPVAVKSRKKNNNNKNNANSN